MTSPRRGPLVSTDWLAAHLRDPDLKVIDATFYLPHLRRDAHAEFLAAHIPGAVFFDVDKIADPSSTLPHMLPDAERFGGAVGALGIGNDDHVVAYGARGMIASARAWWMFRVFGHERVAVLDGGFAKWRAEGRAVAAGPASPAARPFVARFRPDLVADLGRMRDNVERRAAQVVDARSRGRFVGTEAEPRPGLRAGHIPGSASLPYDGLFAEDGTLLPVGGLAEAFRGAGIDPARPVIATCGSGVSACVLAFGLYLQGHHDAAVYDGSWTEWGGRPDTPVEV